MAEETATESTNNDVPQKTRRTVMKTAAQVAVTAPAVSLLLAAGTKAASATVLYTHADQGPGTFDQNHAPSNTEGDYNYSPGTSAY